MKISPAVKFYNVKSNFHFQPVYMGHLVFDATLFAAPGVTEKRVSHMYKNHIQIISANLNHIYRDKVVRASHRGVKNFLSGGKKYHTKP